jgi:hypothetical protein
MLRWRSQQLLGMVMLEACVKAPQALHNERRFRILGVL